MRQTSGPRKRGGPPILAAAVVAFLLATSVQGQDSHGWVDQTRMTGDWGGARTKLEQSGVTIAFQYYTNLAGNPVGGRAQGGRGCGGPGQEREELVGADQAAPRGGRIAASHRS